MRNEATRGGGQRSSKCAHLPRLGLGAYEALWFEPHATFKTITERFADDPDALPSDCVSRGTAEACASKAIALLERKGIHRFGIRVHYAGDYPHKLRDARYPVELLYYRGAWELNELKAFAVVGKRKASPDGIERARCLARDLAEHDYTVVCRIGDRNRCRRP